VLDSNPALEAFGNAMTLRNNNSSRFGKYFELKFDLANGGTPRGGFITNYLLEKSRIVKPGNGERGYHIFYQLIRGGPKSLCNRLGLQDVNQFRMLTESGVSEINNEGGKVNDSKEFEETIQSMQTIGIFPEDQADFFLVVAICLHMSNISFYAAQVDGAEGSQIQDENAVVQAAGLLGVDPGSLAYALTYRTLTTMAPGGKVDSYMVPLNPIQASAARDALSKDLYSRLFDRLVSKVNEALVNCGNNTRVSMRRDIRQVNDDDGLSIGVLDIFGFEIFEKNAFEQFCINFCNEKLQQLFIELTIKGLQQDYANEGIQWTAIPFFDNKVVCDLIEGKKPPGIFAILDDTCKTAHAIGNADEKFLEKLNSCQSSHAHYSKFRGGFSIKHYAGIVNYSGDGFIESNKDVLSQDLQLLAKSSTNGFLQSLYPEEVDLDQRRQPTTAGYKIKQQAGDLIYTLMDCNPHYVRCIKSNDRKKAGIFDNDRILHQVRYLGMLESLKVTRAGFATRMEFDRFIHRFKVLGAGNIDPQIFARGTDYDIAYAILDCAAHAVSALQAPGEAQLGKSKVFIKTPETFFALQELRKELVGLQAIKIQNVWRRFANRKDLVDMRTEMTDIWNEQKKEATAADLLRPYHGFYIKDKKKTDAITELLEWFQSNEIKKEQLEYTDFVKRLNAKGEWEEVLLIITNAAFYIAKWHKKEINTSNGIKVEEKLLLKRRNPLMFVEGLLLSLEADDLVGIQMIPPEKISKPNTANWPDKKSIKRCMETQEPFSFFGKSKHQCHYTGNVYIKEMVSTKMPLPDLGYYTPVSVHHSVPGTVSVEMREDIVLWTDKKAEVVAKLRDLVTRIKGGGQLNNKLDKTVLHQVTPVAKPMCEAIYDYDATQDDELTITSGDKIILIDSSNPDWWMGQLGGRTGVFPAAYTQKLAQPASKPKRANPRRYMVNITFSNTWKLRPAFCLSNTMKAPLLFRRTGDIRDMMCQKSSAGFVVMVPPGVAGQKLREIQANQEARRAKREMERQELMALRQENAIQRETQRKADREKKLAMKKERRAEEKTKRDKEHGTTNFAAKNGASFVARMNGSSSTANRHGGGSGITATTPAWVTARGGGSPAAAAVVHKAKAPAVKKVLQKKSPWKAYTDDDSGDTYYYNEESGESTWDPPDEFNGEGQTSLNGAGSMSYSQLMQEKSRGYAGLDASRLEEYLADSEFKNAFGMNRAAFENLPAWKRKNLKQQAGLH